MPLRTELTASSNYHLLMRFFKGIHHYYNYLFCYYRYGQCHWLQSFSGRVVGAIKFARIKDQDFYTHVLLLHEYKFENSSQKNLQVCLK